MSAVLFSARPLPRSMTYTKLNACKYHSNLDDEEKQEQQDRWMHQTSGIIVATSGFGLGIDAPDVRVVLHWGLPYSLLDYAQQTGRAGRDGLPSTCQLYFVLDREENRITRMKDEQEDQLKIKDAEELVTFVKYLDGTASVNCLADNTYEDCGYCSVLLAGPVRPPRQDRRGNQRGQYSRTSSTTHRGQQQSNTIHNTHRDYNDRVLEKAEDIYRSQLHTYFTFFFFFWCHRPGMCFTCGIPFHNSLYQCRSRGCNPAIANTVLPACWAVFNTRNQDADHARFLAENCPNIDSRATFPTTDQEFASWLSNKDLDNIGNAMKLFLQIFEELIVEEERHADQH
ncbi:P-loop containing nucleoside triphosphate hydrolase protein [Zychaea mexicana]|uniref:P-loop containing nucleoside triphosphate hydrolase protein n=1 Tax=Zychaea mexicana TaxID=64656 RepID=UPI0022FEF532|nr:P-loop containing nucleoside triphosphate hydrolase protein [Zychaea mexicana]KAI9468420.1 P-loop containing nucleoside triphosphate hydrolase protein [Zychaea mexicana]